MVTQKQILDSLYESLFQQAEAYKTIISADLTHTERKDLDTEIKQMFELLSQMTNSQTVLTSVELESLRKLYESKIQELQTILDNIDVTIVKGADGKSLTYDDLTPEQKEELKGADGKSLTYDDLTPEQKEELKGADGKSLTYDDLTPEQKEELKGADGKNLTYDDLTPEQKEQLKGADGKSLTYDDLTLEQKQELKGANGLSAYEVALNNGFEGSQTQWLDSLKSSSSSGVGSSLSLPIAITDVKDLQEWMTSYQNNVSILQQSLNGGTIGGVNINQLNGNLNSLNGNIQSVMNALFGIQEEDDETGLIITVEEGLFEKFEKLYNQVNPPVGG